MKIDEFERRDAKGHTRLVSQIQDVSGDEQFELTIAGPDELVREVFADATIDLTIDSARSVDDMKRQFDEHSAEYRKQLWSLADLRTSMICSSQSRRRPSVTPACSRPFAQ